MSERLEHDLGAIVAADLGDCFGELRPELVAAYRHRQLYVISRRIVTTWPSRFQSDW